MTDDRTEQERLDALRDEVEELPRSIEPARDLWPEIRSRLEDRDVDASAWPARQTRARPPLRVLAAAATVTLVAAAAALLLWLGGSPTGESGSADRGADAAALVADWRALEGEYAGAAEELERTLDEIGDELSPETLRIVEENLRVIDDAIAESRAALERDPANRELEGSLRAAWSSKVEMLQYVTRL